MFLHYYQLTRVAMRVLNWFMLDVYWNQGRITRGRWGHAPPPLTFKSWGFEIIYSYVFISLRSFIPISDISFQEYVFKGNSHPVFYGDLVYKLRRVKDTPNFISSRSKIVKCLRRRQYDPLIIERTKGLVLGPCTHCTDLS